MNGEQINSLKVFALLANNNRYFDIMLDDELFIIRKKNTEHDIKIKLENIKKVENITAYTMFILTKNKAHVYVSLATGYYGVSL